MAYKARRNHKSAYLRSITNAHRNVRSISTSSCDTDNHESTHRCLSLFRGRWLAKTMSRPGKQEASRNGRTSRDSPTRAITKPAVDQSTTHQPPMLPSSLCCDRHVWQLNSNSTTPNLICVDPILGSMSNPDSKSAGGHTG